MVAVPFDTGTVLGDHRAPTAHGPSAPVVVLVHGALDRAGSFARTVRRLPELEVWTYDRRGYGRSAAARPDLRLGLAEDAADLADLLTRVDRPVVVVGHSFGGLVALTLAASRPRQLIAVGVWECPDPRVPAAPGTPGGDALARAAAGDSAGAVEEFFRRMVGGDAWTRLRPSDRAQRLAEARGLIADLSCAGDPRCVPDWAAIEVPVAYGLGGRSGPGFASVARRLVDAVPSAELIEFPEATHGVHLSRPGEFAGFVARVAAPG